MEQKVHPRIPDTNYLGYLVWEGISSNITLVLSLKKLHNTKFYADTKSL